MKLRNLLMTSIIVTALFMSPAMILADPGANLVYEEINLSEGVWWYNYTFYNTSTNGEYLYKVFLDFDQEARVSGWFLPGGWGGTVWEGTNTTTYLDTMSIDPLYDIAAGKNLSGFSFAVNYRAGDIPFYAEFDDHRGGYSTFSGTTVVPEPISSILFLAGGATLAIRSYLRRKKKSL